MAAAAIGMDIKLTPEQEAAAAALLADLQALNAAERDAYADIVADYQAIYAEDREHQVRGDRCCLGIYAISRRRSPAAGIAAVCVPWQLL